MTHTERCPNCGNLMEHGRCPRCDAIRFKQEQRWRTGDRGGKRPERRTQQRTLRGALDGTWHSNHLNLTVDIDTEQGIYRRDRAGRVSEHTWQFVREDSDGIHFCKDQTLIRCYITDGGFLVMRSGNHIAVCSYMYDNHELRTCPHCYFKSPMTHAFCSECEAEFEAD